MDSLNKVQFLKILQSQLNKYNFVEEDKFNSILEILKDIDIIGFDIDFTLVLYNKKNMLKLMYESICKYLINKRNYPKIINYQYHKDFINSFTENGFVIDYKKGNALKIKKDKSIIKCYHGKKELNKNEINSKYENCKFLSFKKTESPLNDSFYVNIDNFITQNISLFMICIELFDKGNLKEVINCYKDIIIHINEAINFNFAVQNFEDFSKSGYFFPEVYNHPELYLDTTHNFEKLLIILKEKGKRLFFATNSNYSYSNFTLEKTLGKNYDKYFDLCFYKSCKPRFFRSTPEKIKCFFLDQTEFYDKELNDEIYQKILNGNHNLTGGSYYLVERFYEKMLNKTNNKYLYIGDNILNDCKAVSKLPGWYSLFIYDKIKLEFIIEKKDKDDEQDDNYANIYSVYFEEKDCLFSLPNIEGIKYLVD